MAIADLLVRQLHTVVPFVNGKRTASIAPKSHKESSIARISAPV